MTRAAGTGNVFGFAVGRPDASVNLFVTYLVIRGGLTGSVSTADDLNVYGLVAVAALVGFLPEAADKLRTVFRRS